MDSGETLSSHPSRRWAEEPPDRASRGRLTDPFPRSPLRSDPLRDRQVLRTAGGRLTSTATATASSRCSGSLSVAGMRNRSLQIRRTRPSPRGPRSETGSRLPSSATAPTSGGSIRSRSGADGSATRCGLRRVGAMRTRSNSPLLAGAQRQPASPIAVPVAWRTREG